MPDNAEFTTPYAGDDADPDEVKPVRAPRGRRRPLTKAAKAALAAAADKADKEVKALVRERRGRTRRLGEKLLEIDRLQLHECFGFTSVAKYAIDRGGVGSRTEADQMLHMVRELPKWTIFSDAYERDAVDWTKLRELLREAERRGDPGAQHELLADAATLSYHQLEEKYRVARGDPEPRRRTLRLAPAHEAMWDQVLLALRRDDPDMTESRALDLVSRAFLQRAGSGDGAVRAAAGVRIVLHAAVPADVTTTPGASKSQAALETAAAAVAATVPGRDGPAPISREQFDEALSSAEIHDVRNGPSRIYKAVPPRKQRFVHDRDQGRCKAPGCMNRGYLHVHHEGGRWVVGHDPSKMLLLCSSHHSMVHRGLLVIQTVRGGFRFSYADGSAPVFVPLDRGVVVTPQTSFAGVAELARSSAGPRCA